MSLWNGWYGKPTGDPTFDGDWMGYGENDNGSNDEGLDGCVLFLLIMAAIILISILLIIFYPKGFWILLAVILLVSAFLYLKDRFSKPKERSSGSEETRICPECGRPMCVRTGKYGPFWGCTAYPACRHTEEYKIPLNLNPSQEKASHPEPNNVSLEKPILESVSYLSRYDAIEKKRITERLNEKQESLTLADLNRAIASLDKEGLLPSGVCEQYEVSSAYQRALSAQRKGKQG